MHTPVALIIFNRPDMTAQVLAQIARVQPRTLLVIADGPRHDRPEDVEKCAAARAVIDRVDWDCAVLKHYSEVNLGCGRRPASGITWVFEQVEEAIILEDDCVPHPSFFRFCAELLHTYRHDERVMHISGNNFRFDLKRMPWSYFFSNLNISWGWATWRRAWRYFDSGVKLWPALRETSWLQEVWEDPRAALYWQKFFDAAYAREGDVHYWDYQWTFACWAHRGLSIVPRVNLVSNIGFGKDATHTKKAHDRRANVPAAEMPFPLRHPPAVQRNREADRIVFRRAVLPDLRPRQSVYTTLRRSAARAIPRFVRQSLRVFLQCLCGM